MMVMLMMLMVAPRVRGRGGGEGRGERRGRRPVQRLVRAQASVALPPLVLDEQQDVRQGEAAVALAAGQQVRVPFQGLALSRSQPGGVLRVFVW